MQRFLRIFALLSLVRSVSAQVPFGAVCNLSRYDVWKGESSAHGQVFVDFPLHGQRLSKEVTMALASRRCRMEMANLVTREAGKRGPVDDRYIYDVMCGDTCLLSDELHLEAMRESGCECAELSTKEDDPHFDPLSQHDFCRRSSGFLLCAELERCGVWNCDLTDFMCFRNEYNLQTISQRGPGSCSAASSIKSSALGLGAVILLSCAASVFLRPGGGD
mmetsp:Transcript_7113/g.27250  ORF Transcript_7113/g.27250 Transcript_7113/m.27250 type:complete len:219 (-) Transcript_7113:192-848(-)|eukprot:scaffold63_cov306-Pinguiococcus_pyrenoidosus.AAC.27